MALPWCRKCLNKSDEKGKVNLVCLGCKWQYTGQEVFDRKPDEFTEDVNDTVHETPKEYWKGTGFDLCGEVL